MEQGTEQVWNRSGTDPRNRGTDPTFQQVLEGPSLFLPVPEQEQRTGTGNRAWACFPSNRVEINPFISALVTYYREFVPVSQYIYTSVPQ